MYLKSLDKVKLLTFLDNEFIAKQYLNLAKIVSYRLMVKITEYSLTF